MNSGRLFEVGSLGLGLMLVVAGASLLVTNLAGLWLASHAIALAPLVVGVWPMLLCGVGIALVLQALASRVGGKGDREARHAR